MRQARHLWFALVLMLTGWTAGLPALRPAGQGRVEADTALTIQTFQFRPKLLEIAAGTRVSWTNSDEIEHTVTSGDGEQADGRFNGVTSGKDSSFSFSFTQPGTYAYFCDRHHFMRGEIRVH